MGVLSSVVHGNYNRPLYSKQSKQEPDIKLHSNYHITSNQPQTIPDQPTEYRPDKQAQSHLDHKPLHFILDSPNLRREITSLVRGYARRDDRTRDTASTPERHFTGHEHVARIFVFTEERQMQEDSQGGSVGGQNDDLGGSAVEGFGSYRPTSANIALQTSP